MQSSETRTGFARNVASWTIRFDSPATSGVPFKVSRDFFLFGYAREQSLRRDAWELIWVLEGSERRVRPRGASGDNKSTIWWVIYQKNAFFYIYLYFFLSFKELRKFLMYYELINFSLHSIAHCANTFDLGCTDAGSNELSREGSFN
jgi:hypothetical protein